MRLTVIAFLLMPLLSLILANPSSSPEEREFDKTKVTYFLYTRDNPEVGQQILWDFESVDDTNWDPTKKTYLLIHGWTASITFSERFVGEFLAHEDCNVIGVDWNPLSPSINYVASAKNALEVGQVAGEFIVRLMDKTGLKHEQVHGIGHSLGAQAIGIFGQTVTALTFQKVPRITGLDPARPYFETLNPDAVLKKEDAVFVDVIHTNSGHVVNGCLSFYEQLGHIDHYPNGGEHQPGCDKGCHDGVCNRNDLLDMFQGCSHDRSIQYFIESINNGTFTATECYSYDGYLDGTCSSGVTQVMGFHCDSNPGLAGQQFFLSVNSAAPYSRG